MKYIKYLMVEMILFLAMFLSITKEMDFYHALGVELSFLDVMGIFTCGHYVIWIIGMVVCVLLIFAIKNEMSLQKVIRYTSYQRYYVHLIFQAVKCIGVSFTMYFINAGLISTIWKLQLFNWSEDVSKYKSQTGFVTGVGMKEAVVVSGIIYILLMFAFAVVFLDVYWVVQNDRIAMISYILFLTFEINGNGFFYNPLNIYQIVYKDGVKYAVLLLPVLILGLLIFIGYQYGKVKENYGEQKK